MKYKDILDKEICDLLRDGWRILPKELQVRGRKQFSVVISAHTVDDLKKPYTNHFQELGCNQFAIHISGEWWCTFEWIFGSARCLAITKRARSAP